MPNNSRTAEKRNGKIGRTSREWIFPLTGPIPFFISGNSSFLQSPSLPNKVVNYSIVIFIVSSNAFGTMYYTDVFKIYSLVVIESQNIDRIPFLSSLFQC